MAAPTDDNVPWSFYQGDGEEQDKTVVRVQVTESVVLIPDRAIRNYSDLREIKIPTLVVFIGSEAFENCHSLETIDLEDSSVKSIGAEAFYECRS